MSTKEAYERKLRARIDIWGAEIDRLKARADEVNADARLKYHKHLEELRSMQDDAKKKLSELQSAGDDAWEDLKVGIEHARDSLEAALKSAAARFK